MSLPTKIEQKLSTFKLLNYQLNKFFVGFCDRKMSQLCEEERGKDFSLFFAMA